MFDWLNRKIRFAGSVLFRGTLPPRAEDFSPLKRQGCSLRLHPKNEAAHWILQLEHPQWGEATVACLKNLPPPPSTLIECDINMSPAEKAEAGAGRSSVQITMEGRAESVLRDRKNALRVLRAVLGDDGVTCMDHVAQRFWPRAALDEELAHDADLDVSSLHALHAVRFGEGDSSSVRWLHSHGLDKVGAYDFNIFDPSENLVTNARDALRAIGFALLEGQLSPGIKAFDIGQPNGRISCVDAAAFRQAAEARLVNDLGLDEDSDHLERHVVLCDPSGGWKLWKRGARPSTFLSSEIPDGTIFCFSNAATELMQLRAKATYDVFRGYAAEVAEFEFPVIVKLGYEVDGGGPDDREHLWFRAHALQDREIDGELLNQPIGIARMKQGQRGRHPVDRLSDWMIITPFGPADPRSTQVIRFLRENREQMLKAMRAQRGG